MRGFQGGAFALVILGTSLLTQSRCQAQPQTTKVDTSDVFALVQLVREELEELRSYTGRPRAVAQPLPVTDANLRQVYFQALTLFRKSNRLCFEYTRQQQPEPAPPPDRIESADVYDLVNRAHQRLTEVKLSLGLSASTNVRPMGKVQDPSQVFAAIVQANRQLNWMLQKPFTPSDVFQQVTVAIAYGERLLERFPDAESAVPAAPEFEPYKMPCDVYRRLLGCYARIHKIADQSGVSVLTLGELDEAQINSSQPGDVYDIASLIVSELANLHAELPGAAPPRQAYYPGRKFPAHVFQRVGILEQQLKQLEKHVAKKPGWLPKQTR